MENEIFKAIPGYEGLYEVSNLGNVKSLPKQWLNYKNDICKIGEKILTSRIEKSGYKYLGIKKDKVRKFYKVHQLVAMAFLGHTPCGHKIVVDHINGNKLDNRLENLQLISSRENCSKDKKNKTSKYTGVHWNKRLNKWIAQLDINKQKVYLGLFNCELKAHLSYQNKVKSLM
jgi:hypothetical protein